MKRRSVFAVFMAVSAAMSALSTSGYADNDLSGEAESAQYTVDTSSGTQVSRFIYGVADNDDMSGIRPSAIKQRDIAVSTYNWETNASNSGAAGGNANDVSLVGGYPSNYWRTPALYTEQLMSKASRYDIPMRLVTLQMMGYAAGDSLGVVSDEDGSSRWKKVRAVKNDAYSTRPDSSDDYIYMDEYVSFLVNMYGTSDKGGVNGYFLDNCPDKWRENFPYALSDDVTPYEFVDRSAKLAQAVRTIDGKALIFAPSFSGLSGCVDFGNEKMWNSGGYSGDNMWFVDYYLSEMKKKSDSSGTRLIDCFDIHYYTEARTPLGEDVLTSDKESADQYRMQAVRTLWDQDYTENSVTGLVNKRFTPVLPTLQASLRINYPGTLLSVSEYDFGGGTRMSGAIAEIDALGTFASEGVYLACLSPSTEDYSFQKAALNLYTDYDGQGSSFGNEILTAKGDDRMSSVYAGTDNGDISSIKLIVTNQNRLRRKTMDIDFDSEYEYRVESAYAIDRETADIIEADTSLFSNTGTGISFEAEPMSAYMIVLSGEMPEESLHDETDTPDETKVIQESETSAPKKTEKTEKSETSAETEDNTDTQTDITSETAPDASEQSAPDATETQPSETDVTEVTQVTEPVKPSGNTTVPMPVKVLGAVLTAGVLLGVLYIVLFDRQ